MFPWIELVIRVSVPKFGLDRVESSNLTFKSEIGLRYLTIGRFYVWCVKFTPERVYLLPGTGPGFELFSENFLVEASPPRESYIIAPGYL